MALVPISNSNMTKGVYFPTSFKGIAAQLASSILSTV